MKNIYELKDKAVLFGWILGILFLTALIWNLTQPAQKYYLLRTVNGVFIAANDPRRIIPYAGQFNAKPGLFGYWYSMYDSRDNMFVFAVFQDGILIPLGAIVSDNGSVKEIIPLSAHAGQIINNLPQSFLQIYITRIENAVLAGREGANR